MKRLSKIGIALIGLEFAAWLFLAVLTPDYDGGGFGGFVFFLVYFHVFLIAGSAILLVQMARWLARQGWKEKG